jgi:hypothetical protein
VVGGGDPVIFLCSHVPRRRFFDGTDQENSKTRGKGQSRKIQKHKKERDRSGKFKKTRRKEWRKEKEEIATTSHGKSGGKKKKRSPQHRVE